MPQKKIVIKLNYSAATSNDLNRLDTRPAVQTEWNYQRIAITLALLVLLSFILYLGWLKYFSDVLKDPERGADFSFRNPQSLTTNQESANINESARALIAQQQVSQLPEKVSSGVPDVERLSKKSTNIPKPKVQRSDLAGFAEESQGSDNGTVGTGETENQHRYTIVENQPNIPEAGSGISRVKFARKILNREPIGDVYSPIELPASGSDEIYLFTEFKAIRGTTRAHEWLLGDRLISKRKFPIGGDRWRVYSLKRLNGSMQGDWTVRITDGEDLVFAEYRFEVK